MDLLLPSPYVPVICKIFGSFFFFCICGLFYFTLFFCPPSPLSHTLCLLVWKLHTLCCEFHERLFLYQNNYNEYVHIVSNVRMTCSGGESGSRYYVLL